MRKLILPLICSVAFMTSTPSVFASEDAEIAELQARIEKLQKIQQLKKQLAELEGTGQTPLQTPVTTPSTLPTPSAKEDTSNDSMIASLLDEEQGSPERQRPLPHTPSSEVTLTVTFNGSEDLGNLVRLGIGAVSNLVGDSESGEIKESDNFSSLTRSGQPKTTVRPSLTGEELIENYHRQQAARQTAQHPQVVPVNATVKLATIFDIGNTTPDKFYGGLFAGVQDVAVHFNCQPYVLDRSKRAFIDAFCAQFSGKGGSQFNEMYQDRRIDAVLVTIGRTDLRRGACTDGSPKSQNAFDALVLNDGADRVFTIPNMANLGYAKSTFDANYDSKRRRQRHPMKWQSYDNNPNAGCQ